MKALHAVAARLGHDHEALRDLARLRFHVVSIASLSDAQLCEFVEQLRARAGQRVSHSVSVVKFAASKRQVWKILQLEKQLGWDSDPSRLAGFIARQASGKRYLKTLTIAQASIVIEGLKKMLDQSTPAEATPECQTISH
jgi:hypothetical protein